jgi:uncharacterized membrane protein YheB (UPF0754 family)
MTSDLLFYIVPPAAGALIGYATNYIAIRMLFRPLEEKRVLGVRVPLTPGIIPARRRELAANIGRMVGDHLLTREVLAARFRGDDFLNALYVAIARRSRALFDRDLGPLVELVPADLRPAADDLLARSRHLFSALAGRLADSPEVSRLLAPLVQEFTARGLAANIADIVDVEAYGNWRRTAADRLAVGLAGDSFRQWVGREFDRLFTIAVESPRPLGEILPRGFVDLLRDRLEADLPGIMARLSRLLYDPHVRQRIKDKMHAAVERYIGRMGFWQKLLASWALSEEVVRQKIDEVVELLGADLAAVLQQPEMQEKVMAVLDERLQALLAVPMVELAEKVPAARLRALREYLKRSLLHLLAAPATVDRLLGLAEALLLRLRDRPFGRLAADVGFTDLAPRFNQLIMARIEEYLRSPAGRETIADALHHGAVHLVTAVPLGVLSLVIPYEVMDQAIGMIHRRAALLLEEELPQLTDRLDIPCMVEERINTLPVLKVESLLMDIMKEHFTYINLFGALLGALIGLFQVGLMLLR